MEQMQASAVLKEKHDTFFFGIRILQRNIITHTHTDPWRKNLQQTGRNTVTVALGTSVASWNTQTSIAAAMDNYDDYAHVGLYQPCLKQQMEITDAGWPSQIPASWCNQKWQTCWLRWQGFCPKGGGNWKKHYFLHCGLSPGRRWKEQIAGT